MQAERLPEPGHPLAMSCLHCDVANLLELPDPDFENLIEQAFLEGTIDGETQDLVYTWLEVNHPGEQ